MVLPEICSPPAGGGRDGAVRSQLVQPRGRRAGDGLLHRGTVSGVHAELSGVRAHVDSLRDSIDQILVLRQRRGAGAALSGPHEDPHQAMEAEPDGFAISQALGRIFTRQGRDVRRDGHQAVALVCGECGRQEMRPAERDTASAVVVRLPRSDARAAGVAETGEVEIRAPANPGTELHSAVLPVGRKADSGFGLYVISEELFGGRGNHTPAYQHSVLSSDFGADSDSRLNAGYIALFLIDS